MIMALVVMLLLTSLGIALLFLAQLESSMSHADTGSKIALYAAEAGLEDAREQLRQVNIGSSNPDVLDEELLTAAGGDNTLDFDLDQLQEIRDGNGNVVGLTGYDDDVPLRSWTAFGEGAYAAFLSNDAIEGESSMSDLDGRGTITAVGIGPRGSYEVVRGIVQRDPIPPFPALITMLGPDPVFHGGTSDSKWFTGDDCNSGTPAVMMPVVGTQGTSAENHAEAGIVEDATYNQGGTIGTHTVDDVSAAIHPLWTQCSEVIALATRIRGIADVVADGSVSPGDIGTTGTPKVVFIDDDLSLSGGSYAGLLWVTGDLDISGDFDWNGIVIVGGTGRFDRDGAGTGAFSGAWLVANVAGPDGTIGTSDDCSGPDGITGNGDDGFAAPRWWVNGVGAANWHYCDADIDAAQVHPFRLVQFLQR